MTVTPVPQADGEPMAYVTIGELRIPVYNVKFTPPPRKPTMNDGVLKYIPAEQQVSETEKLIRDFAAATYLDIATVRAVVNDALMSTPPVTPAEALAELDRLINSGLVLHSTAAKGQSRKNIRKRDPRRKQIVGPSKKRTAAERRAASDKLRAFNRRHD